MNRFSPATVDVHQHLWPAAMVGVLRARKRPPRLDGWQLELADGSTYSTDPRDHDVAARSAELGAQGLARALISLSAALGIEGLPSGEAAEILDAWHEGALAFPGEFGAWAATGLSAVDPDALERRLDQGFVGLSLPAGTIGDRAGFQRVEPLLAVLERRGAPLFVHPGPAARTPASAPAWWPPVVDYVGQMHRAWFAFRAHGRERHPELRLVFALLAGLAPLHGERFASRAHERTIVDPLVFVETSSYGPRAIDAVVRVLGIDVILAGSDRPYASFLPSGLAGSAAHAVYCANAAGLLQPMEVSDDLAIAAVAKPRAA